MSNKMSIWVFVSVFWAFYWYTTARDTEDMIIAFGPLVLGWGIWLIRR
ncbi:MAG: hypothetical protein V3S21_02615 [Xanthomonadales bacterium]